MGNEYWYHTHNQYLTYFVIGGIFGYLLFMWAVFYPLSLYFRKNILLLLVQLVILFSFITEDTLETQPGVTMYVLFLAMAISLFKKEEAPIEV